MSDVRIFEGGLEGGDLKIAIVAARFNDFIVERLLQGALQTLTRHGVPAAQVDVIRVPGAFELPVTVAHAVELGRYSAIIALGCIIRGDTPHFDFVAGECTRGLGQLAMESGVPVIFGVLTTDTVEQAMARAQTASPEASQSVDAGAAGKQAVLHGNKGAEAAECAVRMANLLRSLEN